jgi:hypothetical protein
MKLSDAIANLDWSEFKLSFDTSWPSDLARTLYPDSSCITDEHYEAVEETGRVKKYAVREWLCTDQHVGIYLFLVDDVPVCITHQAGRKCDTELMFLSPQTCALVKQIFDDHRPMETTMIVPLVDDDLMHLHIDQEFFDGDYTPEQLGLSPIMASARIYSNLAETNGVLLADWISHVKSDVADHMAFMDAIQGEDADFIQRATDRSAKIYADALALLARVPDE